MLSLSTLTHNYRSSKLTLGSAVEFCLLINPSSYSVDILEYSIFSIDIKRITQITYLKRVYNQYARLMREYLDLPNMPEYLSIKDAAKMLGVSDKRVYG